MPSPGYAMYDAATNRLEVVRPGENCTRYINCMNLNPRSDKVFGVQVDGDEIWVLVGPSQNQRKRCSQPTVQGMSSLTRFAG